jgi:hypothetical protein
VSDFANFGIAAIFSKSSHRSRCSMPPGLYRLSYLS